MITVTSAQLDAWLAMLMFPLVRFLAMISSSPVIGNRQVPARVKIGLSALLAIIVAPTLDPMPQVSLGSAEGLLIMLQQVIIGVAIGLTLRLIFSAVEMAGELVGLQMGLGFASFYDPLNASFTPIIARWYGMIAALAFLAMNGHLMMLSAFVESFHTLPIGQMMSNEGFREIAVWGGNIFAYALQISLPVLAALLATNVALGILTRAATQLNLFAVGFPITMAIGFLVLALSLANLVPVLDRLTGEGLSTMLSVIKPDQR
jgi:flagellar biosynthetic protein FliR